nr:hypothetical protein CFP56_00934 [Quercus suber]
MVRDTSGATSHHSSTYRVQVSLAWVLVAQVVFGVGLAGSTRGVVSGADGEVEGFFSDAIIATVVARRDHSSPSDHFGDDKAAQSRFPQSFPVVVALISYRTGALPKQFITAIDQLASGETVGEGGELGETLDAYCTCVLCAWYARLIFGNCKPLCDNIVGIHNTAAFPPLLHVTRDYGCFCPVT